MKNLKILKFLVDCTYILGFVGLIISPIIFIFAAINSYKGILPTVFTDLTRIMDIRFIFGFILSIAIYALSLYCLKLFRDNLKSFINQHIFDSIVIANFKKIGHILISIGTIITLINFIGTTSVTIVNGEEHHSLTKRLTLDKNIVLFMAGLFSYVLAEVFNLAKRIKAENDLTI
jgi:hypothetical protein